jgi:hypothetical protein
MVLVVRRPVIVPRTAQQPFNTTYQTTSSISNPYVSPSAPTGSYIPMTQRTTLNIQKGYSDPHVAPGVIANAKARAIGVPIASTLATTGITAAVANPAAALATMTAAGNAGMAGVTAVGSLLSSGASAASAAGVAGSALASSAATTAASAISSAGAAVGAATGIGTALGTGLAVLGPLAFAAALGVGIWQLVKYLKHKHGKGFYIHPSYMKKHGLGILQQQGHCHAPHRKVRVYI